MRKSIPLLRNIDRIVPLSLEIFNRHVARSKVFPYFAETYGTLESGLLFFFCFVHLYHRSLIFSVQKYKLSSIIPIKTSKTCQRSRFFIYFCFLFFVCSLFHWSYHTLNKGYLRLSHRPRNSMVAEPLQEMPPCPSASCPLGYRHLEPCNCRRAGSGQSIWRGSLRND